MASDIILKFIEDIKPLSKSERDFIISQTSTIPLEGLTYSKIREISKSILTRMSQVTTQNTLVKAHCGCIAQNTPVKSRVTYLVLDRKNCYSQNAGEYKWVFITSIKSDNVLNIRWNITNVSRMTIAPFMFPRVPYNMKNRIAVEFMELTSQLSTSCKWHAAFEIASKGAMFDLQNLQSSGTKFEFSPCVTTLDSLTVRFYNPDIHLILDNDSDNAQVTPGTTSICTFSKPHNCAIGDLVTCTGDYAFDEFGYTVLSVTANSFEINANLPASVTQCAVYFESKRFSIQVQLTHE
jgi:hypothetical protein